MNSCGEDIVDKYGLDAPMLLTRDRVSLAIAKEVVSGLGYEDRIVLDLTNVSEEKMRLLRPILPKMTLEGKRRFLVAPIAHFQMGGVKMNEKGETSVSGLYAAGEVCGGIHGTNRLYGNALTEVWVFGSIAGREAAKRAKEVDRELPPGDVTDAHVHWLQEMASRQNGERLETLRQSLKEAMWRWAGIIRSSESLRQCLKHIESVKGRYLTISVTSERDLQRVIKLGNMLTCILIHENPSVFRLE